MKVAILNNIPSDGLTKTIPSFQEVGLEENPEAIFVRSENLKNKNLPGSIHAICRAGTGTDNVSLDWCNENGVVVFNAPGANTNSVKELVISVIIAASRNLFQARQYVHERHGEKREIIEGGRSKFMGSEIHGKSIYLVGAGKIGALVSEALQALGMKVFIYDPWAPEENFRGATKVEKFESVPECEFISIHCSPGKETEGLIGKEFLERVPRGIILINSARGEIVDREAIKEALVGGHVSTYISDFHDPNIATKFPGDSRVGKSTGQFFSFPHLGASTHEAQERAFSMVAQQFLKFWQTGAIKNSVNFPTCTPSAVENGSRRLVVSNFNAPGAIGRITNVLGAHGHNISYMLDRSPRGSAVGYNVIDIDNPDENVGQAMEKISELKGVTKVRVIK